MASPRTRKEFAAHLPLQKKAAPERKESSALVSRGSTEEEILRRHESGSADGERASRFGHRFADISVYPKGQENRTGLPDDLKAGAERLSGLSMDDVRVHYNSDKPAAVQARAYAQGAEIHVGPGQEAHLAHEAWHVVQQKQGRVPTTRQARGVEINDDPGLEGEAEAMGREAARFTGLKSAPVRSPGESGSTASGPVQRVVFSSMDDMWAAVHPQFNRAHVQKDKALLALYQDAAAQLSRVDFVQVRGQEPQATATPNGKAPYRIDWDTAANVGWDSDFFAGSVIHELAHVASAQMYDRNGGDGQYIWAEMNLPEPQQGGTLDQASGLMDNQIAAYERQLNILQENLTDLDDLAGSDRALSQAEREHVQNRCQYAYAKAIGHNDTVLGDILYYLQAKGKQNSETYKYAHRMLEEANERRREGERIQGTSEKGRGTEARRVNKNVPVNTTNAPAQKGSWWSRFWK